MKNILFLCLVFCMSCKKDIGIDKTPTITAEVNGVVLKNKGSTQAYQEKGMVVIRAWGLGIDLYMEDLQVGEYLLGMNQFNEALLVADLSRVRSSNINKQTGGKIIITHFDAKDSTISGTFEFVAQSTVSLDSVKNGKFDNIKIVKSEKAFFNKVSFKKDGEAMKFQRNSATLYARNLYIASSRYVSGENFSMTLALSTFQIGKQNVSYIGSGTADKRVVYLNGSSFYPYKVDGTYEWIKLDTINNKAQIAFDFNFENNMGEKVKLTEGMIEVNYEVK